MSPHRIPEYLDNCMLRAASQGRSGWEAAWHMRRVVPLLC